MEQLGLSALADTRIGDERHRGLSGGEKRRVSIGLEFVAKPDVLILDELVCHLKRVWNNSSLTCWNISTSDIRSRLFLCIQSG